MKKVYPFRGVLCALLLSPCLLLAQVSTPCVSDGQKFDLEHPDLREMIDGRVAAFLADKAEGQQKTQANYTIPVVLHVMHLPGTALGTAENLSNAQAEAGLAELNRLFTGEACNGEPAGTPSNIQFCLAKQDATGHPISGINRFSSTFSDFPSDAPVAVALQMINAAQYRQSQVLNIFIVRGVCDVLISGQCVGPGVLGTMPTGTENGNEGIVVAANLWYDAAAPCQGTKTVAHQVGHFLNLFHTYEGGCNNSNCHLQGDRVCDTPPENFSAASDCSLRNTCATDSIDDIYHNPFLTDVPDATENYMSSSARTCQHRFTAGQVERMQLCLEVLRPKLSNSIACQAPCLPVITGNMTLPAGKIIAGQPAQFSVALANASSISWAVNGQMLGTGNTFTHNFPGAGEYAVQVQAGNANGCAFQKSVNVTVYHSNCNIAVSNFNQLPICRNGFKELELYPSNGILFYPNGNKANGNVVYADQLGTGTFTLKYEVTDGLCVNTKDIAVSVSNTFINVSSTGMADCKTPQPLTAMISTNANWVDWFNDLGDDGFWSSGNSSQITLSAGGYYTFEAHTPGNECVTQEYFSTANNNSKVKIQRCTDCSAQFVQMKLCAANADPGSYFEWTNGLTGAIGQQATVTQTGLWKVRAVSPGGCESYDEFNVTNLAYLRPSVNAGTDHAMNCYGNTHIVGATNMGDISMMWSTTDGHLLDLPTYYNPRVNRPGTYVLTATNNMSGCSNTDTTRVFRYLPIVTEAVNLCAGENYNGLTASGIYDDTVQVDRSCYKVNRLDLTIAPPIVVTLSPIICAGDNYEGFTQSGNYQQTFTAANGCDSTVNINLTVLTPIVNNITASICAGQSFEGYSQTGVYSDQFAATNGCDSVRVLQLTVLPNVASNISQTICAGESFEGYSQTGVYTDQFAAANGCDSVRVLQLTVLPNVASNISQTICAGESFEGYSQTGVYTDQFAAANGCDSVRVLQLTVLPNVVSTISQTICAGESSEGYSQTGVYTDQFTAANGCDSVRVLQLTVLPNVSSTVSQTICAGESFEGYSQTGVYTDQFATANGCDSVRVLQLTVLPNVSSTVSQTICAGESFEGYSQTGLYTDQFAAANGCDSVRVLQLTVLPESSFNFMAIICPGDSIEGYSLPGVYTDTFVGSNGCDSTRTLVLVVQDLSIDTLITADQGTGSGSIIVQAGSESLSFLWSNGSTQDTLVGLPAGTYTLTVTNLAGCTQVYVLTVPMSVGTQVAPGLLARVYPNPLRLGAPLRVELPEGKAAQYELWDVNGRLLEQGHVLQGKAAIQVSSAGVYLLKLRNAQGQSAVYRVLVL